MPFVLEEFEEGAVFDFLDDFYGDATGDVNTAQGEHLEGEIAGLGTIDGHPEIEGIDADWAGLGESFLRDFGSGIGVGIFKTGMSDFGSEEFVQGAEAAAGEDELPAHLRITAAHEAEKLDLLFGVGREIGVAALGRDDAVALAVPDEEGLTEAGARSEKGPCATGLRFAWIQNAEVFRGKMLDAVAGGTEVIHEDDLRHIELSSESASVDGPRKIGGANAIIDDGSGDAKTCSANRRAIEVRLCEAREFLNDEVEGRKAFARETLTEDGSEDAALFRK